MDLRNDLENEKLVFNDFADALQALNFFYKILLEEFLNVPEENVIYKVPKDDQIIEELVYLFKNTDEENMNLEKADDS